MKKVLGLIIVLLLFGCAKKGEVAKESDVILKPYIISQEYREFKLKIKNNKFPYVIVPFGISVESNLIIDENSNMYYYQRASSVGFGNDYHVKSDSIPKFLDLNTKDLIRIPNNCIKEFVDENVMTKERRRQILIIASQKDTIIDQKFLKFLHYLKVPIYVVRRTTQEEDTVLRYKKVNKYYDYQNIKWDKSKIKFPENIKFVKRPTDHLKLTTEY